ncbi:GNAT family N-acetyltransferase [Arthrobacter sp.]|jgi:GNAT superfamily N-acetyltransferase|uniref:GNAT family N-acetyltransferase n=1 Tax=Arthrobacter sp. TaxID=1667 RepID=UPI0025886ECA|nr:GNAT family N-acetyltransferase [Arthrobacter sp.]
MLEIRPAALSEFSLLPALEADADQAFATLDPPFPFGDFPPPGTAASYAGAFHIMVAGRPPVGFARLEIVDGQAHLGQLAVSPEHARRGIGRALVMAAKAWALEVGFHTMTLCTFADVPFNGPFYASCGFVEMPGGPERQLPPGLAALRREEVRLGLDALGRRIAMCADLR